MRTYIVCYKTIFNTIETSYPGSWKTAKIVKKEIELKYNYGLVEAWIEQYKQPLYLNGCQSLHGKYTEKPYSPTGLELSMQLSNEEFFNDLMGIVTKYSS